MAVVSLPSAFPSGLWLWHRPKHRHQGAVRIFTVGEGVIKTDAHESTIHLELHRLWFDGHHLSCLGFDDTSVVPGVVQHRFGVVLVHVFADPCTHGVGQGVSGHCIAEVEGILTVISSSKALPQQQAQANSTEAHISSQHYKQPNGQGLAQVGWHRIYLIGEILTRVGLGVPVEPPPPLGVGCWFAPGSRVAVPADVSIADCVHHPPG